MDAKELLYRIGLIREEIRCCERMLAVINSTISGLQICRGLDSASIDSSNKASSLISKLSDSINELVDLWDLFLSALDYVDRPLHRVVLERHWLLGETWETIAADLHYDIRYVQYLGQHARISLQSALDKRNAERKRGLK